jgi:hypothetical protein
MDRRTRTAAAHLVGALALVTATGCDGGGAIPFDQLQPSLLGAVCHLEVLCGIFPDAATCMVSVYAEPHLFDTLGPDIASGKVVYDGAKARACVDSINGLSSCDRSALATLDLDPVCGANTVFKGTVAAGGPCFFSEECAAAGTCQKTDTSCTSDMCCAGTCIAMPAPLPVGGDCSVAGATCASGTVCVFDSSTSPPTETCQTPVGIGAPCVSVNSCTDPLYCDVTSKTCQSPVATGEACNPSNASLGCNNPHDLCDPTTMICTAKLGLGSVCNTGGTCASYAVCDTATSTCVERPTTGASCDPTNGPSCLGGTCDATTLTCTLPVSAGACS